MRKYFLAIITILFLAGFCPSLPAAEKYRENLLPGEELISFTTADKMEISGSLFYPARYLEEHKNLPLRKNASSKATDERYPMVLLLHMWKRDRYDWIKLIPRLQEENYLVLAIDLRGHGKSLYRSNGKKISDRIHANLSNMKYDALAAYQFACRQSIVDPEKISVMGASIGATVALKLAYSLVFTKNKPLNSIVLLSPAENYFNTDITEIISKHHRTPILFVLDRQDPSPETRNIFDSGHKVYESFQGTKKALISDGLGHGTKMFASPQVISSILEWLNLYTPGKQIPNQETDSQISGRQIDR